MGLRLNLLAVGVFLLSHLRSIQAKSPTFEVVGAMHCNDCINNRNSSQGLEVVIRCNANEMRARGNGGVDESGKFNVTLSAETAEDSGDTDGCYAKLQSRSGAPCHIQAAQTASVKIISNSTINITRHTAVIKFSPITCQSAFFWLFPNLTIFGSRPQPKHTPPQAASPVQPPSPSPQPSYDTPAPSLPPTVVDAPSPPPQNGPSQSPVQTPSPTQPPTVIAPTPASSVQPVPAAGISAPPFRGRPNPIPKAPPIPELPVTPSVPRKYFNPPKSRSKPPRSV
ncbi:hypothetical protein SASPL_138867 [Salvia splendens]|uniref:Uncharacterized protein n=1 Tax=Salvia splendens TaxID=180675 RepID=A0A8X8ZFG3_SALSN|nr:proline-rich protein 2-like isoform X2 [Salvia splendens]KAG6401999.1 hypothetical protein SASPL_138867 [Salvia splendens]